METPRVCGARTDPNETEAKGWASDGCTIETERRKAETRSKHGEGTHRNMQHSSGYSMIPLDPSTFCLKWRFNVSMESITYV